MNENEGELINLGVLLGNFVRKQSARLSELSGKLLPIFGYKRGVKVEGKRPAPWELRNHLKLVRRRRKKEKKIQAKTLP